MEKGRRRGPRLFLEDPGSPASLLAGVEQKPHLARAKVLYRRVGPRSSGVSTGATGGASTALVAGRVGCLEAPPESRAAMRRDRSRSAICLGTSTDLIKLIGTPSCAVTVKVGSSGAKTSGYRRGRRQVHYY